MHNKTSHYEYIFSEHSKLKTCFYWTRCTFVKISQVIEGKFTYPIDIIYTHLGPFYITLSRLIKHRRSVSIIYISLISLSYLFLVLPQKLWLSHTHCFWMINIFLLKLRTSFACMDFISLSGVIRILLPTIFSTSYP